MKRQEKEEHDIRQRQLGPVIDTEESVRADKEQKEKMDQYARIDAIPYLRNGFYQDEAVARKPENAARILLATPIHWKQPLKTQDEVAAIQLYVSVRTPKPVGRDAEIMMLTKIVCEDSSLILGGDPGSEMRQALLPMIMDLRNEARASTYSKAVTLHLDQGGSLVRSNALHVACGCNDASIVKSILEMDPLTISARDEENVTPLMVAAVSAAGRRRSSTGFSMDHSVIDTLLAAGADKDATNSDGLTAYGLFLTQHKGYQRFQQTFSMQQPSDSMLIPGYAELEAKLKPRNGPTPADLTGGDSEKPGIIYYSEEEDDEDEDLEDYDDYDQEEDEDEEEEDDEEEDYDMDEIVEPWQYEQ
jgi:hypothetical protein